MKKLILITIMLLSTLGQAHDIEVVNCDIVLKNDTVPDDKMLSSVYEDIEQNSFNFVCAYNACDEQHNKGWFAIKKDRSVIFIWDKAENTTASWIGEYNDDGNFVSTRVKYNRYGIRDIGRFTGEKAIHFHDTLIDVLLASVDSCID